MSTNKIDISGTYLIKTLLIVGGILTLFYIGSSLIMPLVVAAIIATLLNRPTRKLKQWGLPNWLSILISILVMVITFLLLSWLIGSQLNAIANDWPTIQEKAVDKLNIATQWANKNLDFEYKDYFEKNKKLVEKMQSIAGLFAKSFMDLLSQSLIIFVYIILLLIQKQMFIDFLKRLSSNSSAMSQLLSDVSKIISGYLIGKSKIMLFLFGIYYLGFTLGSVPFALFLAVFGALFQLFRM